MADQGREEQCRGEITHDVGSVDEGLAFVNLYKYPVEMRVKFRTTQLASTLYSENQLRVLLKEMLEIPASKIITMAKLC